MKITHSYTRFWLHANPGNKVVSPSECSTRHNASCVWSSKLQKCTLKNQFQNPFLNVIYSYSINPYSYSTNLLQSTQTIFLGPTEVQWASSGFWLKRIHLPVPWGFFYYRKHTLDFIPTAAELCNESNDVFMHNTSVV